MAVNLFRHLVRVVRGPLATVYCCPYCDHRATMRKGIAGVGRGYGLRMGGTLSTQMAAHIREKHSDDPRALKTLDALAQDRAAWEIWSWIRGGYPSHVVSTYGGRTRM